MRRRGRHKGVVRARFRWIRKGDRGKIEKLGMEQMIDRISHNSLVRNGLAVCPPRQGRPLLMGSVKVDRPIPVGVCVRVACRDVLPEADRVPLFQPASTPQPVGTLLDCYL